MSQLTIHKNIPLLGLHKKPIITDFYYQNNQTKKPVVVFCHGYKGYKDWGAWHLMLKSFASAGFFTIAFNFSHNGGTLENPIDFPDLEAFGNDNFTKQQDDLQSVIDEVFEDKFKFKEEVDLTKVSLIGHSRGGAMTIIKAAAEKRISKIVTLASISTYENSFPEGKELEDWKREGVTYVINGRTKQKMPLYYQLYENYSQNKERFNAAVAAKKIQVPHLIVHGTEDKAVVIENAEILHKNSKQSELYLLETDHVFGAKQPWEEANMPEAFLQITEKTIAFLKA